MNKKVIYKVDEKIAKEIDNIINEIMIHPNMFKNNIDEEILEVLLKLKKRREK